MAFDLTDPAANMTYRGLSQHVNFESVPDPEDRFSLEELIGEGTYGEVYKARDKESGSQVAVKILENVADNIEEIEEEFLVLRDLSMHPNIPDFHGIFLKRSKPAQEEDQLWFVMELCTGGSVTDLVQGLKRRGSRLTDDQIAYILHDTVEALIYLHNNHCMHRDVKGHNILLTEDARVKLVDFGVSSHLAATHVRRNTSVGTPYWMAPEVIACEQQLDSSYDSRCDIWSVGITAIELAEGDPPLFELHPMRALFQIPRNPPPSLKIPDMHSAELSDFIAECLVKDMEHRPFACELKEHPLLLSVEDRLEEIRLQIKEEIQKSEGRVVHQPDVTTKHGKLKTDRKTRPEKMYMDDLAALDVLSEDAIVDQLQNRYERSQIYTYIGDILVSVNPFTNLGLYTGMDPLFNSDTKMDKSEKKINKVVLENSLIEHDTVVSDDKQDFDDICQNSFLLESIMITHRDTILDERKDYACDKCKQKFEFRSHLSRHQISLHKGNKNFACDNCDKKFVKKSSLFTHQKLEHKDHDDYSCSKCERKFENKSNLFKHQKIFHKVFKDYLCEKCAKRFENKHNLLWHIKTIHEGHKDYACDKCEKKYGHKSHLLSHLKIIHENRKDFACDKCEKKFGLRGNLSKHQKTVHERRKDYTCDKCEKKYGHKSHLLSHLKIIHENRKDFACDKCEKKFGQKSDLFRHRKTVHERRNDYACDRCEKKFGEKSTLIKHQNTVHEGCRDYECDKCKKKFGHKYHLLSHQKTVHEGQKDFTCDKCEKKFGRKSYLLYHQKLIHEGREGFTCDKCEKKFGHKSNLLYHQKIIHEGRKDFACDKCEKKFGQKSTLLIHQKTVHGGCKDYSCDKCEKKFGLKSYLLRHQKTVHEGRKEMREKI